MNPLSLRLAKIASFIPKGAFLADVGSDHGYLPIYLAKEGKIAYAQAIDNKSGPYETLKQHIDEEGVSNIVEPFLSDGLTDLKKNIDTLSICGMGGLLINEILEEGKEKLSNVQTIVVDCHRDIALLREKLLSLSYAIVMEEVLFDKGIYYTLMRWEKVNKIVVYSKEDIEFGPIARKKKEKGYLSYLKHELEVIDSLLGNPLLPRSRKESLLEYKERIERNL